MTVGPHLGEPSCEPRVCAALTLHSHRKVVTFYYEFFFTPNSAVRPFFTAVKPMNKAMAHGNERNDNWIP